MAPKLGVYLAPPPTGGGLYRAGSRVHGTVWVQIDRQIKGGKLAVSVSGKEHAQMSVQSGKHSKTIIEKRTFLAVTIPMENYQFSRSENNPRMIQPGNYDFPFAFDIPEECPSTFRCDTAHHTFCQICYKVKCEIQGSGVFTPYMRKKVFAVQARPTSSRPLPVIQHPKVFPISNFWRPKGSMSIGASLDNTLVTKGVPATLSLGCRNNSTGDVVHVSIQVTENLHWSAQGRHRTRSKVLWRQETAQLEGLSALPKGGKRNEESVRNELEELRDAILQGNNSFRFSVPTSANASYQGGLLKLWHAVVITVKTNRFVTNPSFTIPIQCFEAPAVDNASERIPSVTAIPEGYVQNDNPTIRFDEVVVTVDAVPLFRPTEEEPEMVIAATAEILQPSVETLCQEMEQSFRDLELVRTLIGHTEWEQVFATLSPQDFGRVTENVHNDFDQPEVAEIVAMRIVPNFMCAHLVSALGTTAEWNKVALVERLVSHCSDLESNYSTILDELDEWEKLTAQRAIVQAHRHY